MLDSMRQKTSILRSWLGLWPRAAFVITAAFVFVVISVMWNQQEPMRGAPDESQELVKLTLLENAKEKGALCLDGSPPGYHLQRGFGSGDYSWVIHIEGGGWCSSLETCLSRAKSPLGSSNYMEHYEDFDGILSSVPSRNPDFYNWNKVKIRYCDGGSFSGDVASDQQFGKTIYFRGQRIWEAIMDELLKRGLGNAKQALLTGCSAGSLATYIHCDAFRASLPKDAIVKCLGDGGFFLDAKDITGSRTMMKFYDKVVKLQNIGGQFGTCTSKMEAAQCFFPREIVKSIKTPLFILNSAYDSWQVQNVLVPLSADPQNSWLKCKLDIKRCNSTQIEFLQGFRNVLLDALSEARQKADWGMFINSCSVHCQTLTRITWHSLESPRINSKTIAEAVGDWYFDRKEVKEIDCPYPCNPTCYNRVLTRLYRT